MTTRRSFISGLLARGAGGSIDPIRAADTGYPTHPVRIIVPFAPGGGADAVARLLAPLLFVQLRQPFLVENRAGAAGRIGTGLVAKSPPDGHTLLVTTESSLAIAPHIGQAIGYDPLKDFVPISLLTRNMVMLVVHPSVQAKTLQEYIALAKAEPGKMFFASSGVGGPNHLAGEIFNRMAGIHVAHVPYPGTGLALQAVLGNQVGAMWGFAAGLAGYVREGSLRAIAIGGKDRSPALPEVPTVAESGVPGFEATSWIGMVAPTGTPQFALDTLKRTVGAAMREGAVHDNLIASGSDVIASSPEEFRQVIETDYAKYAKLTDLFVQAK